MANQKAPLSPKLIVLEFPVLLSSSFTDFLCSPSSPGSYQPSQYNVKLCVVRQEQNWR
jgi:hypothetical protein